MDQLDIIEAKLDVIEGMLHNRLPSNTSGIFVRRLDAVRLARDMCKITQETGQVPSLHSLKVASDKYVVRKNLG
jgi:hypothetical protein